MHASLIEAILEAVRVRMSGKDNVVVSSTITGCMLSDSEMVCQAEARADWPKHTPHEMTRKQYQKLVLPRRSRKGKRIK